MFGVASLESLNFPLFYPATAQQSDRKAKSRTRRFISSPLLNTFGTFRPLCIQAVVLCTFFACCCMRPLSPFSAHFCRGSSKGRKLSLVCHPGSKPGSHPGSLLASERPDPACHDPYAYTQRTGGFLKAAQLAQQTPQTVVYANLYDFFPRQFPV
jgi:hypothetical protein